MSSKTERQKQKAYLLSQIQQQRLDLAASYDRGWNTLLNIRAWALVGSSVVALCSVRHPSRLIRWARRGFGVWSAWRLVKSTLRQQQLRS